MSKSEAEIRKIKDKLLHHTTLLSQFIQKLSIPRSKDHDKNIGLIKREIQTILKELSLLNGYYTEATKEEILTLIDMGARISHFRERKYIIDNFELLADWISRINTLKLSKPIIIEPELDQKYELLKERYEKNLTILRPWIVVKRTSLVLSVLLVPPYFAAEILVIDFHILNFTISGTGLLYALFLTLTFFLASDEMYKSIAEKRKLTNDDLLYVFTGRVISLLDGYIKNKISNNRIEARELMEKIINLVNKWNYGNFIFIRNQFGTSIDLFKENLKNLTLGVINTGSDQDITNLIDALSYFLRYMINPSINGLNDINKLIEQLPYIEFIKLNKKDKITFWIYSNPNYPRLFLALFASTSFYLIGIYYFKASPFDLYPTAAAILVAIFLGIDRILSLDKKLTSLNEKRSKAGIT